MAQKTRKTNKAKARAKELNFIFFVDANRTHAFKMPLNTFRGILLSGVLVAIWAIGSIGVIYNLAVNLSDSRQQAGHLLTTIFDYQTRYDSAYENAYANEMSDVASNVHPAKTSENTVNQQDAAQPNEKRELATRIKQQDLISIANNDASAESDAEDSETSSSGILGSSQIEIAEPNFSERDGKLRVDFAIKNLVPETRTSGRFIAIARLKFENGKDQFIAEPPSIRTSADGKPQANSKGTRFLIKRFKPVSLEFTKNATKADGKYEDIYISIEDEHGQVKEYTFPIIASKIVAKAQLDSESSTPDTNAAEFDATKSSGQDAE